MIVITSMCVSLKTYLHCLFGLERIGSDGGVCSVGV